MKKTILTLILLNLFCVVYAQKVADIYPGNKIKYLTDKGAADFEKAKQYFYEKTPAKMTDSDWDYVEQLGFNELSGSYWNILDEGCSWYCANGGPIKIVASSTLTNQGSNNYSAQNLHDLMYNTSWVEGVKGYGIGEWIEYTFKANNPRINRIHVVNGYCKSQTAWKNNSRVRKLKVYVNNNLLAILNLEDSRSDQTFEIQPITFSKQWTMRFEILDVYKGEKYDDTVLSEIYFDGLDDH